jgi:hypothetical protein
MHAMFVQIHDKLDKLQDTIYLARFREALTQYLPRSQDASHQETLSLVLTQVCSLLCLVPGTHGFVEYYQGN